MGAESADMKQKGKPIAKKQLGKHGPMATNTDEAIEELLDGPFSTLSGPD
jgi:hypothetical protein